MRSPVAHCADQLVDAERVEPAAVEAPLPVRSSEPVFGAGEDGHPEVDVAVDVAELAGRVASPEVRPPAPQHGVEVGDHPFDGPAHPTTIRAFTDRRADRVYRPI